MSLFWNPEQFFSEGSIGTSIVYWLLFLFLLIEFFYVHFALVGEYFFKHIG